MSSTSSRALRVWATWWSATGRSWDMSGGRRGRKYFRWWECLGGGGEPGGGRKDWGMGTAPRRGSRPAECRPRRSCTSRMTSRGGVCNVSFASRIWAWEMGGGWGYVTLRRTTQKSSLAILAADISSSRFCANSVMYKAEALQADVNSCSRIDYSLMSNTLAEDPKGNWKSFAI